MKRRVFITLLGVATVRKKTEYAQQSTMPIVGFMNLSTARPFMEAALRQGLSNTGYSEGQNVTTEYHWAEGHNDRLSALAADLVRRRVSVIVATGTPAALAAKGVVTTIPIVFETAGDP